MIRRCLRSIVTLLLLVLVVAGVVWSTLAVWFDGPNSRLLAAMLGVAIATTILLLATLLRPRQKGLLTALLPVVVVILWWISIPPSNSRDWNPDVARTAHAVFDGTFVTIQNVRNFKYRSETDYDQRWETRTYNLDQIQGVDLFLSFWGPTHTRRCEDSSISTNSITLSPTSVTLSD